MDEEKINKRLKRMTIAVVGIALLLIITGGLFALFLLSTMKDAALDQMRVETKEYNKRLYDQIDADYQIIKTFASIIGDSSLSGDPDFPEMLDKANYQNDFLTMIYADVSGNAVAATLDKGITDNILISDVQPEVRYVLEQALAGKSAISQLFQGNFSNEAVFVYAIPVYRGTEIAGAIAASDKVEIFGDILDGEGVLGGYGYINMIDREGNYIVHSEKDDIGDELDNVFSEPYFNSDEAEEARKDLREGKEVDFSFSYEGSRYEALIQPIGINDWCLLSIGDIHTSSRQVYMLVRIMGTVFGVAVILVLFLLIYGCRMMRRNCMQLKKIAYYDSLTGALNLFGFRKQVGQVIQEQKNYSIIALNVHQFRFINEFFGKDEGDQIIYRIGMVIRQYLRTGDILCRESGDMFYVFTKECDEETLRKRFKKIMDNVTLAPGDGHGDYEIHMYCGATVNREGVSENSLDETMAHVLAALRCAKEIHQNNIWIFDKKLHKKEIMDNYVETHMNQAIRDKEFSLFLQPKISLQTGKISGAEALVRWIKSDGEIICPGQFIPLFESNGFCIRLDMYMFESVCRQIREWMDRGLTPVPVSVNQSKRVIYEKDYLNDLTAVIEKYQIPANLITLEILEGLALENVDEFNRKIEELQKKGFRVSLDDFGTEYSSFSTFSKLQVDELKLDRWFVKEMNSGKNEKIMMVMEEIIQIAHKLNISTVVEGVETPEDHRLIREMHCDYGQGFHYSRPVSAQDFTQMYLK